MKKILVINGPNLNLLGLREPAIYGSRDYKALEAFVLESGLDLSLQVECFQSNHEGAIVDKIQQAYGVFDGIVINPGLARRVPPSFIRITLCLKGDKRQGF